MDPGKTLSLERLHRQGRRDQRVGPVVRAVPCRNHRTAEGVRRDRASGVAFLGIDVRDNNRDAASDFVVDRKVTYPSIYDPAMRTMIAFGGKFPTTVIPSTLVLDRQHRVAAVFLRELLAGDLMPVVQRLAGEQRRSRGRSDRFRRVAAAGPLLVAVGRQHPAGLVSFASPCVVPLVPGYLSYLAAVVGAEDAPGRVAVRTARLRVAGSASLFVAGFTAVFVLGTVAVLGMTTTLITNQLLLQRIGGVLTIVMGLVFVGFIPALQRQARFTPRQVSTLAARRCSARFSRWGGRRALGRR